MGTSMAKPAIDPGIVTSDAEPMIEFYTSVFGLKRLDPLVLPGIGTIHKLAAGESILRIMVPEQKPGPDGAEKWSSREGIRYLTFEVVSVHAAVESVVQYGGTVALAPIELRPGRMVSQAHDPDGNMLEIGQG